MKGFAFFLERFQVAAHTQSQDTEAVAVTVCVFLCPLSSDQTNISTELTIKRAAPSFGSLNLNYFF